MNEDKRLEDLGCSVLYIPTEKPGEFERVIVDSSGRRIASAPVEVR